MIHKKSTTILFKKIFWFLFLRWLRFLKSHQLTLLLVHLINSHILFLLLPFFSLLRIILILFFLLILHLLSIFVFVSWLFVLVIFFLPGPHPTFFLGLLKSTIFFLLKFAVFFFFLDLNLDFLRYFLIYIINLI